jgi:hypothetical protein
MTNRMSQSPEDASASASDNEARAALLDRCNTIEEAYEFMLGYAAQGLSHDAATASGAQIRDLLRRSDAALTGLGALVTRCVQRRGVGSLAPYDAFIRVLERDARDAQATIQLVLAQPSIGSQLVDNLNASIHVRALLTDLFLLDEVLQS